MVGDPDEVGRGGRALLAEAKLGDRGFGRHTIGSNFSTTSRILRRTARAGWRER